MVNDENGDGKFRIGIASFAHMHAWSYLSALQSFDDVEIVAIAEENKLSFDCIKDFEKSHGYKIYDKYDDLIADEDIDCILITTENAYHADIAVKALEHNKHVIVEKPIATTLEDAERMLEAAKKSKGILAQCYPCRYHPTAMEIKKLFDSGDLGNILAISSTNHGQMPPADGVYSWFSDKKLAGGGALMDHITHVADLIFWFTSAKLTSIYAVARNLFHPDRDIDDAGMVLMEFDNGMKVSLDPSWSRPDNFATWGDVTMTIFATNRTIQLNMFGQNLDIHRNKSTHPIWENYGSNMDELMLRDFIDHLKKGEPPMLTGEDGYRALEVVIKAYESAEKGEKIELK